MCPNIHVSIFLQRQEVLESNIQYHVFTLWINTLSIFIIMLKATHVSTKGMQCCVSMVTMVTRACHSAILYVYCLSCYILAVVITCSIINYSAEQNLQKHTCTVMWTQDFEPCISDGWIIWNSNTITVHSMIPMFLHLEDCLCDIRLHLSDFSFVEIC